MNKLYICFVAVIFVVIACNKLPLGDDEFDLRGNFDAQEVMLTCENTLTEFNKYAAQGNSPTLIVGKNNEYEARVLLRFSFPDSQYQGLDGIKLVLRRNTTFDQDTIRFTVHLVSEEFYESDANWYKRTDIEYWDSAGGDYELDSLVSVVASGDSMVISFNYIQLEDIRVADGLILVPQEDGFIYYHAQESGYPPQFLLEKNEETVTIPIDADLYIITGPEPFFTENWIGAGLPYRNYARFVFDTVLVDKKALYADLTFKINDYFSMRDSVEIGVRELLEPLDDFNTATGPLIALKRVAVADSMVSLDLVQHIERIIEYPDSNFGFFIVASPDYYEISRFRLEDGSHQLHVGYIEPPEGRF
jgi:hypothetical protein